MGEIDGDIGIVYNMFGNKLTSGNNMASTSPFSTFFEKYSCFVCVDALHVTTLQLWGHNQQI